MKDYEGIYPKDNYRMERNYPINKIFNIFNKENKKSW